MINYSIIIPHYNSVEMLRKCLASIPERKDIQIIVVDDNSDSREVDFNHFPGLERNNVEVVFSKKRDGGAGYARNQGLKVAQGKWLYFVDADDFLPNNCFEILDQYLDSDFDIVYFNADSIYIDTGKQARRHVGIQTSVMKAISLNQKEEYDRLRFGWIYPVAKLIKRKITEGIFFDEVSCANDVMFSVKTAAVANKIAVNSNVAYIITVSKGSITNRQNINFDLTRLEVRLRMSQFLKSIGMSKFQLSSMYLYINCCMHGTRHAWIASYLYFKYKVNPFIGCTHWIKTIIDMMKNKDLMKKYVTD